MKRIALAGLLVLLVVSGGALAQEEKKGAQPRRGMQEMMREGQMGDMDQMMGMMGNMNKMMDQCLSMMEEHRKDTEKPMKEKRKTS